MSEEAAGYLAKPAERVGRAFKVACDTHCVEFRAGWPVAFDAAGKDLAERIYVDVIAYPKGTGLAQAASLTPLDIPTEFARDEIEVSDSVLSCMSPDRYGISQLGFRVALEPGMAAAITDALDQLGPLLDLMKRVYVHVGRRLVEESDSDGPLRFDSFNYAHGPAAELVRLVYFDGWDVDSAAEFAFEGFNSPPLSIFKDALCQALHDLPHAASQRP